MLIDSNENDHLSRIRLLIRMLDNVQDLVPLQENNDLLERQASNALQPVVLLVAPIELDHKKKL